MEPGHSIGLLGFRRWYSRQLVEAHMWLVSSILCAIVALAAVEHASLQHVGLVPLLMVLLSSWRGGCAGTRRTAT
jgi:hypothetical protein